MIRPYDKLGNLHRHKDAEKRVGPVSCHQVRTIGNFGLTSGTVKNESSLVTASSINHCSQTRQSASTVEDVSASSYGR
jgi:hypothetical protein